MLTASDSTGTYTWTYQDNRIATQTDPYGITLTYGYDENGNVTSISDSQGGSTTMTYNAAGQVTQKTFQNATTQLRVDFSYDDDGNLILQTSYNDLAGTWIGIPTLAELRLRMGTKKAIKRAATAECVNPQARGRLGQFVVRSVETSPIPSPAIRSLSTLGNHWLFMISQPCVWPIFLGL